MKLKRRLQRRLRLFFGGQDGGVKLLDQKVETLIVSDPCLLLRQSN